MRLVALVFLLAGACASAGSTDEQSTLDRLLDLRIVRDAKISPDGRHIAFSTFENDFDADKDVRQLWVVGADGGTALQLTRGEESVAGYTWTARPDWVSFQRDGTLHVINVRGGEAIAVDLGVEEADDFTFATDGSTLYFLAGEGEETDHHKKLEARKEAYGDYQVVREDGGYQHLWRARLTEDFALDGEAEQLTAGRDYSVTGFSLSPDDGTIAFATWPSPHLADLLDGRLYLMPTDGGAPVLFDDRPGYKSAPVWHVSGEQFAYLAGPGFAEYSDIYVAEYGAQGAPRVIDMPELEPALLHFDERGLFFAAPQNTTLGLYRLNPVSDAIEPLSQDIPFVFDVSFSRDGSRYAYRTFAPPLLPMMRCTPRRRPSPTSTAPAHRC